MKQPVAFVYAIVLFFIHVKGETELNEEPPSYHHLSGKTILSNIIRKNNFHNSKFLGSGINGAEDQKILSLFLNRFQPALDRETNRLLNANRKHLCSQASGEVRKIQVPNNKGLQRFINLNDAKVEYPYFKEERFLKKRDAMSEVCTKIPGKIMCKFGRYNFVINTNHDLGAEELEKTIAMMHQRVSEGDRTFDLSVVSPGQQRTAELVNRSKSLAMLEDLSNDGSGESPVLIECTLNDRYVNAPDATDGFKEAFYSCRKQSLKLKRDSTSKNINQGEKPAVEKADDEKVILATPKAKTCSTLLYVRKFTDVCISTPSWCQETSLKPCSSTYLPHCIPWCNPFLKDPKTNFRNQRALNKTSQFVEKILK